MVHRGSNFLQEKDFSMAGSVNKVILVGNLGGDPEVRTMQSGDRVANFSLATSESWKDKQSGQRQERTQWHKVVVYNQPLVNVAEQYLKKGAKVYVEGQVETRKYTDRDGQEKYITEIVLRPFRGELTMLDGRGGAGANDDSAGGDFSSGPRTASQGLSSSAAAAAVDDDIPF